MLKPLLYFYIVSRILGELLLELVLYSLFLPFWKEMLLFGYHYFGKDPYAYMHRYVQEQETANKLDASNRMNFVYGPTPLSSLHYILYRSGLSKHSHIFDLGCGPGRGCV